MFAAPVFVIVSYMQGKLHAKHTRGEVRAKAPLYIFSMKKCNKNKNMKIT